MKSWNLQPTAAPAQAAEQDSFLGGKPKLPPGTPLPRCGLCQKEMTFFFQVAFPQGHPWQGRSMAVFYCTDTWHDAYCIPEFPPNQPLKGAQVTREFLSQYQRNFCVLLFDTASAAPVEGYQERIAYQPLTPTPEETTDPAWDLVIGGRPIWIMGKAEKPASVAGEKKPLLLLQLREDFKFPILPATPKAASPFFPGGLSPFPWYDLFARNRVYFWGAKAEGKEWVYIAVQSN